MKNQNAVKSNTITFKVKTNGVEMMKFTEDGKIYVRGELIEENVKVVEAIKSFLMESGHLD